MRFIYTAILCCFLGSAYAAKIELFFPPPPKKYDVTFPPGLEGIYEVKTVCRKTSATCDRTLFNHLDRITISDTRGPWGIWTTFATKRNGDVLDTFLFSSAGPAENQLSGYPVIGSEFGASGGKFGFFELTVDPATGGINGSLIFSRDASSYEFHGKKLNILQDVMMAPKGDVSTEQLVGVYRGKLGRRSGRLIFFKREDGQINATYTGDDLYHGAPMVSFIYTLGSWDPQTGLIRQLFLNQRFFSLGELVLAAHINSSGKVELNGFQYTAFSLNAVKMIWTSPLTTMK